MSTTAQTNGEPKKRKLQLKFEAEPRKSFEDQLADNFKGFVSKGQAAQKAVDAATLAGDAFPEATFTELIDIEQLVESEKNPRQDFADEDIEGLAKSIIKTGGLMVAILARPAPGHSGPVPLYEIADGARRHRALRLLRKQKHELGDKALVDIRPLTDAQLAEAFMTADRRKTLTPFEQARGFSNMLEVGHTKETIASTLGISVGTVHARLKLLDLGKRARAMLLKGGLPPSVATPLARYPEALQAEALEQMLGDEGYRHQLFAYAGDMYGDGDKVLNARACVEWLQENFTKSLKSPPFDQKDDALQVSMTCWPDREPLETAPGDSEGMVVAPACGDCPKNSRNLPREIAGEDLHGSGKHGFCTMPACYQAKWDATLEQLRAKAKQTKEIKVLSPAQSEKALKNHYHDAPYVKASDVVHEDPKKRTWGQLLAAANEKLDEGEQLRKVIATTEEGKTELVERGELLKVLAGDGAKWAKQRAPHDYKAQAARESVKRALQAAVGKRVLHEQLRHIRLKGFNLPALRAVIESTYGHGEDELDFFGFKNRRELEKWIEKDATEKDLIALLYMRSLSDEYGSASSGYSDEVKRVAAELKLDLKELEKATAEAQAIADEEP
jgi:ParB/RepB/Spo0J family partition protein